MLITKKLDVDLNDDSALEEMIQLEESKKSEAELEKEERYSIEKVIRNLEKYV